jgi:hypothetical protein
MFWVSITGYFTTKFIDMWAYYWDLYANITIYSRDDGVFFSGVNVCCWMVLMTCGSLVMLFYKGYLRSFRV